MSRDESVEIDYDMEVRDQPASKAFQIGKEVVWIPKSLLLDQDDRRLTIEIPLWLAKDRGLV